jgi:tetratricopeptide (TPR) repeat protein
MSHAIQRGFHFHRQGLLDKAEEVYIAILTTQPRNFDALHQLGVLRFQQGRHIEALDNLIGAQKLRPADVGVLSNIGLTYARLGRLEEALASFDGLLALKRDHADALNNRGNVLKDLKRSTEALASYDKAITLNHISPDALNNRGNVLRELKRFTEALASYDRALAIKPSYAGALNNRGNVLKDLKRPEEALSSYDKAIEVNPSYLEAHINRGNALKELGRTDEALVSYERAIGLEPYCADAHSGKGLVLIEIGRFSDARISIEKAIRNNPRKARYYYDLSVSRRFAPSDHYIRTMEELAQDMPSLATEEQIYLHFALAKAFADTDDRERSFQHLLSGNALQRKQIIFEEAGALAMLEHARASFSGELMRRNEGIGDPSPVPIFVLGMPRSGTTLVEQILASHPKVFGAGEVDCFQEALRGLNDAAGRALHSLEVGPLLSAEHLRELGAGYVSRIQAVAPHFARITDKNLDNFRFVGLIAMALPNSRIIYVRRDPVDTCFSCFSSLFSGNVPYAYNLGELARYHRAYDTLMAHWREVLPRGMLLGVQYESVVADIEREARRVVDHCGLDWDARCLSFYQTHRQVRTASATQVRRPLYKDSVGRSRGYERFLGPLLSEFKPSTLDNPAKTVTRVGFAKHLGAFANGLRSKFKLSAGQD